MVIGNKPMKNVLLLGATSTASSALTKKLLAAVSLCSPVAQENCMLIPTVLQRSMTMRKIWANSNL